MSSLLAASVLCWSQPSLRQRWVSIQMARAPRGRQQLPNRGVFFCGAWLIEPAVGDQE